MEEGAGELDHSLSLLRREVVYVSTDEVELRLPAGLDALIGLVCDLRVPCLPQLAILVHYPLEGCVLFKIAVPLIAIIFNLFQLLFQCAYLALYVLCAFFRRVATREKLTLRALTTMYHRHFTFKSEVIAPELSKNWTT